MVYGWFRLSARLRLLRTYDIEALTPASQGIWWSMNGSQRLELWYLVRGPAILWVRHLLWIPFGIRKDQSYNPSCDPRLDWALWSDTSWVDLVSTVRKLSTFERLSGLKLVRHVQLDAIIKGWPSVYVTVIIRCLGVFSLLFSDVVIVSWVQALIMKDATTITPDGVTPASLRLLLHIAEKSRIPETGRVWHAFSLVAGDSDTSLSWIIKFIIWKELGRAWWFGFGFRGWLLGEWLTRPRVAELKYQR